MAKSAVNQGIKLVSETYKVLTSVKTYDSWIKLNFLSGGEGHCLAEMRVAKEHVNMLGTLHGGFVASLIDTISGVSVMTVKGDPGVTVEMNVTYMKAAKLGEDILINAKTLKAGKSLAYNSVIIKNKADGNLIATGTCIMFINQNQQQPKTPETTNNPSGA